MISHFIFLLYVFYILFGTNEFVLVAGAFYAGPYILLTAYYMNEENKKFIMAAHENYKELSYQELRQLCKDNNLDSPGTRDCIEVLLFSNGI